MHLKEMTMAEVSSQAGSFKPKKSVALSGVTAGNTALCTVVTAPGRVRKPLSFVL